MQQRCQVPKHSKRRAAHRDVPSHDYQRRFPPTASLIQRAMAPGSLVLLPAIRGDSFCRGLPQGRSMWPAPGAPGSPAAWRCRCASATRRSALCCSWKPTVFATQCRLDFSDASSEVCSAPHAGWVGWRLLSCTAMCAHLRDSHHESEILPSVITGSWLASGRTLRHSRCW